MEPAEVLRQYFAAARGGDWPGALAYVAEDVVVRVPGRSRLAGTLHGRDAFRRYIEAARAASHGGDVELELVDLLAGEERVVLLVHERFHVDGRTVDVRRANVYRVAGGRIVEIAIFEGDQYAVDELLG